MYKILLLLFWCLSASAEPMKIVVIDTGIDLQDVRFKSHMCKEGHTDFTGEGLNDTIGHGTAVVGLIQKWAGDSDYCIVMLKFYLEKGSPDENHLRFINALTRTSFLNAYAVNMSVDTAEPSTTELDLVRNNSKTTFIIAAGNHGLDLDDYKNHPYMAGYPLSNIISVGNGESNLKHASSSNYGWIVKQWIDASRVLVEDINGGQSFMSGTSMSSAIYTGKFVYAHYH